MASKKDVEAGKAYVMLYCNQSALVKGLKAAGKQLQSFGAGIAGIGGIMTAAGGAVLGPMVAMVHGFSSAGDAVHKMALRTGMGAEAITELKHAAELSGTDVDTLEKGVRKMQQTLTDAAGGSKTAQESLARFGVTAADLIGLSPDKQMEALADGIMSIQDPAARTAAVMDVFGKAGTQLLPMLSGGAAGIEAMRKEAQRLGLTMSDEDAASAAALNDAMGRLKSTLLALANRIGAALAPAMTWLSDVLANGVATVIEFVRNNKEMIVMVAAVAAGVVAVGTAIVGLGGIVAMAGVALSGLAAVFSFLLSPIGLVVAAVAGLAAWFFTMTEQGRQAADSIMGDFGEAFATVKDTVGGIVDALSAGDLGLAAQIAMSGVKLAFFQATKSIREWWINLNKSLVEWIQNAANQIIGVWRKVSQSIAERLADLGYKVSLLMSGEKNYLTEAERKGARDSALNDYYDGLQEDLESGVDQFADAMQDSLDSSLTEGADRIEALKKELSSLRSTAGEKAAAARAEREANKPPETPAGLDLGPAPSKGIAAAVTFSGAALRAMGQGGGPMDRLVTLTQEQKALLKEQVKHTAAINFGMAALKLAMTIE